MTRIIVISLSLLVLFLSACNRHFNQAWVFEYKIELPRE